MIPQMLCNTGNLVFSWHSTSKTSVFDPIEHNIKIKLKKVLFFLKKGQQKLKLPDNQHTEETLRKKIVPKN